MTKPFSTLSIAATARLAGVFYLILAICGGFAEFGVRQRLIVPGDATVAPGPAQVHHGDSSGRPAPRRAGARDHLC